VTLCKEVSGTVAYEFSHSKQEITVKTTSLSMQDHKTILFKKGLFVNGDSVKGSKWNSGI
jgi:hypothetical protein